MEEYLAIDHCAELKEGGFDTFGIMRQLLQEFGLSIGQAKVIMVRHETIESLAVYRETLVEPLIPAFGDAHLHESEFEIDDGAETVGDQFPYRHGLIRERI